MKRRARRIGDPSTDESFGYYVNQGPMRKAIRQAIAYLEPVAIPVPDNLPHTNLLPLLKDQTALAQNAVEILRKALGT